jgi:hypothetical protein
MSKYLIVRDTQEKANFWNFEPSEKCIGTTDDSLSTGDYTIKGMEDIFTIERKYSTGEFSGNITEARFERQLCRMDAMKHSFLVLEFTLQDVYNFPSGSGIPSKKWSQLRVTPNFILKRLIEIETDHKCKIIFAGNKGEEIATTIFKRMQQLYA